MKKLTAEKCREFISVLKSPENEGHLALTSGYHLQALEIALPILEQQERLSVEPVAFTGSGSLAAIKAGAEGVIWGSKADAHPIELFARYPASFCQKCNNTGSMDSGGTQPWGEAIMVECDCQFEQREQGEWIEWGGGDQPVNGDVMVETKWSDGSVSSGEASDWRWDHRSLLSNLNLIAYRIIPERATNQNGEQ